MEDESDELAEWVVEGEPDTDAVSVGCMVADVEGEAVLVKSLDCVEVIEPERVVREVAVPDRLTADVIDTFGDADVVLESENDAVVDSEGDPDTVSATEGVPDADTFAERV